MNRFSSSAAAAEAVADLICSFVSRTTSLCFTVSRRSATVLQQSAPVVLKAGEVAPPLALQTVDGSLFSFPSPGGPRILLIYFWNSSTSSTQIGLVRDVYSKFHAKGLEVLGVNVDDAGIGGYLSGVLQKADMS